MVQIKPFFVSETEPPEKFDSWKQAHVYEITEAIKAIFPADMIEDEDLQNRLSERMAVDLVHEDPIASAAWDKLSAVASQREPDEAPPTIPFEHNPKEPGTRFGKLSDMLRGVPETKNSRLREVGK